MAIGVKLMAGNVIKKVDYTSFEDIELSKEVVKNVDISEEASWTYCVRSD